MYHIYTIFSSPTLMLSPALNIDDNCWESLALPHSKACQMFPWEIDPAPLIQTPPSLPELFKTPPTGYLRLRP